MTDDDDDLIAPHRPGADWRCRDDDGEWPCPIFRRRMWVLYRDDRDRLPTFMAHFRDRAAPVLVELTTEQLDARFVGWTDAAPIRRRLRSV
ncbi:hypothetical protein OG792_24250 [Micromonospora sp. NBC_01699]|uniref:hypothetical protein n=1 Tax=Micromonospora sp. NBC_01699 TaxID=2975984 RepID=UPI002E2DFF1D|nr:hypothetical protein [Micromonospora sp. NBC_01699]